MQARREKPRQGDNPYADCQLKSWQGHTTGCSSMLQNSVDVNHYGYYLDKAMSADKHDSNVLAAECERSHNDLKNVEKSVAEDDIAHDYLIDANEKEAVEQRAAVAAAQVRDIISYLASYYSLYFTN